MNIAVLSIISTWSLFTGLPRWHSGKESSCKCRRCRFHAWFRKILWRRKWQPTPIFFPGKFSGERSLSGYNPWGCKESDVPERLRMCIIPYLDKKMSLGYYNLCKLRPFFPCPSAAREKNFQPKPI